MVKRLDNFSNVRSYAMLDLACLGAELKRVDALSPKGDLQDSSRTAEPIEPTNEASEESNAATDAEGQLSLTGLVHLRGFFRLLKKGPGIPSQVLPPLKPRLPLKKGKKGGDDSVPLDSTLDAEFCCFKSSWKNFSLSELQEATNNFNHGIRPAT